MNISNMIKLYVNLLAAHYLDGVLGLCLHLVLIL